MFRFLYVVPVIAYCAFVLLGCSSPEKDKTDVLENKDPLFVLLSPDSTNIHFVNTLEENLNLNVLMYEYLYNGGGVAVGDVNGDGLQDIYFSGNTAENKLYLNKGNLKFEDITSAAGVGGRAGPWKTGVTMADVNGDGLVDIYVCYSGKLPAQKRVNQLFINQGKNKNGIPAFTEQAARYGLADSSFSTQGYFFDYDKDGDLDMLLLNHNPTSLPVLDEAATANIMKQPDPETGIRLFRNDKHTFRDVTFSSKINSSALTYGLGAGIADINGDGWTDIYICNDYSVPDYFYINNKNGSFTDVKQTALGHTTHFGMGNDISDINNDALPDIIALDMLPEDNRRQKLLVAPDNYEKFDLMLRSGFYYQYMRNMLQLNNGNGTFSEIGQLAGISNTDWSWAPLVADYDNDGWKDMFVTNGYTRDYTDMDFIKYMNDYVQHNRGDMRRQNVLDMVNRMPATDLVNYMFRNNGDLTFTNVSTPWGFTIPSNSNGAVYADLDNDGALDLIINNINKPAFIYHNQSAKKKPHHYLQINLEGLAPNTQGLGTKITLFHGQHIQYAEQMTARGFQSSVTPVLHFGLGEIAAIDSIRVEWLSGRQQVLHDVKADRQIFFKEADASPASHKPEEISPLFKETVSPVAFAHTVSKVNDFKRQPLMVNPMSFFGPCMVKADVNGDGLEDVYAGGAVGQPGVLYIQQPDKQFAARLQPAFENDKAAEDADAVFFDANGDGFPDLYIASGGYHNFSPNDTRLQDRLYLNDGKGNFKKDEEALPKMYSSKSCVRTADINGDGAPDLFVGGRVIPGRYPETPESYVLINDGKGNFSNQTEKIAPGLQRAGMVTDAAWADINGDGQQYLMITGEWMPLMVFKNTGGKLDDITGQFFERPYYGWWNKLLVSDLNGDGKPDLIAGNQGLNTQCRVNEKEPAELYYKDFDGNGSVDPMLCFYIQHKSYPYVTRDELLDQMSGMRARYTSYKSYADQRLTDIFSDDDLRDAGYLKADELHSSVFLMGSDGKFHSKPLPLPAQLSPVFTITALDYNKDGNPDILLCGNINQARLRFGKYDAGFGVLLRGDGKGNFEYIPQWQSGFELWGDVRSVLHINDTWLFGINQREIKAYTLEVER